MEKREGSQFVPDPPPPPPQEPLPIISDLDSEEGILRLIDLPKKELDKVQVFKKKAGDLDHISRQRTQHLRHQNHWHHVNLVWTIVSRIAGLVVVGVFTYFAFNTVIDPKSTADDKQYATGFLGLVIGAAIQSVWGGKVANMPKLKPPKE